FKPLNNTGVGLYSCGPTVYNYAHIGNMRSFLLSDLVRRTLEWNGYKVKQVINITDVGHLTDDGDEGEDKIEKAATATGQTVAKLTKPFIDQFFTDLKNLHINTENTLFPHATNYIDQQIDLIKKLVDLGFTYQTTDGVYFDITKYPKYTELGRLNLAGQEEDSNRNQTTTKKHPADFALWKFSKQEEKRLQEWPSPWGVGFPGWHLECSAMSMDILAPHFDIHTGGEDHVAVHHTNERAQSESATGEPFVNFWLHNAFITINKEKMAKSAGNFYTVSDLINKGYPALAYRYLLLGAHYRSPLNFSLTALTGANKALLKINQTVFSYDSGGQVDQDFIDQFTASINNDLNTAQALALVYEVLDSSLPPATKRATIEKFDQVLGILDHTLITPTDNLDTIPTAIMSLVESRQTARLQGDWKQADLIREQLEAKGYTIKDTPSGEPIVSKKD
ncbi:MAG: cysteine--tRNA ligase, partial [Candidatus Paceibacterota bacterium]